jgi:tRNA dimethylallyltransferase
MMAAPRVVAIIGPTASGKTALSIEVARRIPAEIICMDSRQVYRGMDVGTAKPTLRQRELVPHFGLDLVDPDERFSAGRFAAYARATIARIQGRGRLPMLVGGTGFFLRALTHPIFEEPPLDVERRSALREYLGALDVSSLRNWLAILDPGSAEKLASWGGRQRLLRALELPLLTGRSLSWWHANAPSTDPLLELSIFVLDLPRERLDRAIDDRVTAMADAGLVVEVAGLLAAGYDLDAPGMNATGYAELVPYLRGQVSLEQALDLVRRNTRAYARRQLTWLRKQLPPGAIRLDATLPLDVLTDRIVETTGAVSHNAVGE